MTGVGTVVGSDIGGDHTTSKVLDEFDGCIVRRSSILTEGAGSGVLGGRAAAKGEAFPLHLGAIFAGRIGDGAGLTHQIGARQIDRLHELLEYHHVQIDGRGRPIDTKSARRVGSLRERGIGTDQQKCCHPK